MSDVNRKKAVEKTRRRTRAHQRIRQRVTGTEDRPRLSVYKSARYVYAQLIDDGAGRTLAAASSSEPALVEQSGGKAGTRAAAKLVGALVAERAIEKGIKQVVFDRGGYRYHGKVRDLAEAAREKGLEF